MSLESAIFAALGQYGGLSALVGARIYPDVAPQGVTRPYVVWQEISGPPVNSMDGSVDMVNYRVQVTAWSSAGDAARAIRLQVRAAMAAASGTFKSLCIDTRMLPFEPDTKLRGAQADFSVWLRE